MALRSRLTRRFLEFARARGYEVTPEWRLHSRPLVLHLRGLFERYGIDCVFDVGGNLGHYHDLIRDQVGFRGLIISFEPVSQYAELLKKRAADEANWVVCDFALGSAPDTRQINVTKAPGLSSFLSPKKDVVEGFWRDDSFTSPQTVRIKRLDDVMGDLRRNHSFDAPYLKIDTQGFDLEVLKGATRALSANVFRALQMEASVRPIYDGAPTYDQMVNYLYEAGFELSGLFPVLHDPSFRLIEFDCVVVNRTFA
jgi:FkbM family methyltransferase